MFALQLYVSAWRHGVRVAASFVLIFLALAAFAGLFAALPLVLAAVAAPSFIGVALSALAAVIVGLIGPLALGFATQPDSETPAAQLSANRDLAALDSVLERL